MSAPEQAGDSAPNPSFPAPIISVIDPEAGPSNAGKRNSDGETSPVKRARRGKERQTEEQRQALDLQATVDTLRRSTTGGSPVPEEDRSRSRTIYTKAHYQRDCIVLLLIVTGVAQNNELFSAPWLRDIHDVEVGAATSLYRLLSANKKATAQKEAQKALEEELPTILTNKNHWNYWYRKLADGPTGTEDLVDVRTRERTTSILREDPITAVPAMTQRQPRQSAIRFDQQQRTQPTVAVGQPATSTGIGQPVINPGPTVSANATFGLPASTSTAPSNTLGTAFIPTFGNPANPSDFYRRPAIRMPTPRARRGRGDAAFAPGITYDRRSRHAPDSSSSSPSPPPFRRDQAIPGLHRGQAEPRREQTIPETQAIPGVQRSHTDPEVQNELEYLRTRVRDLERPVQLPQTFPRDERLDEVPRQYRRMETLSQPSRQHSPAERPQWLDRPQWLPNNRYQFPEEHRPTHRHREDRFYPVDPNQERRPERRPTNRYPEDQLDANPPRAPQPRALRPQDIMMYDPAKQTVGFFIRRFRHIAELEGHRAVLRVLPLCLENDALEWHNGLSPTVQHEMNQSLAIWEDELLREYRPDRFESIRKAQEMTFRFGKDTTLSQYLSRKTNTLRDGGIHDETLLVHYLWEGLDAQLALATPVRQDYDTVESFSRRVRANETAAKKVHDLFKRNAARPTTNTQASNQYQPRTDNRFVPSANRVQRLINNYQNQKATPAVVLPTPAKPDFKKVPLSGNANSRIPATKTRPPRPCRHCGGPHWDKDCPDPSKTMMAQVKEEEEEGPDEEPVLDDYDRETLEALEALQEEPEEQGEEPQEC